MDRDHYPNHVSVLLTCDFLALECLQAPCSCGRSAPACSRSASSLCWSYFISWGLFQWPFKPPNILKGAALSLFYILGKRDEQNVWSMLLSLVVTLLYSHNWSKRVRPEAWFSWTGVLIGRRFRTLLEHQESELTQNHIEDMSGRQHLQAKKGSLRRN